MEKQVATRIFPLAMEVLQQFRQIFGSLRHHFRELEERCGLPGSQLWVLQEVQRSAGIGISDLARRMGIHQSTCSLLVERLVEGGLLEKSRNPTDQRRVGLTLGLRGADILSRLPGPAEGILPGALSRLPDDALRALQLHLASLIDELPGENGRYAGTPLAEMCTAKAVRKVRKDSDGQ